MFWHKLLKFNRRQEGIGLLEMMIALIVTGMVVFGATTATVQILRQGQAGYTTGSTIRSLLSSLRTGAAAQQGQPSRIEAIPESPTYLVANAISASQIAVGWVDNSNHETGFYLERATDVNFLQNVTNFPVDKEPGHGHIVAFSDTSVSASTTYYYHVRATSVAGNSGWSNTANATTPAGVPNAPSSLVASAVSADQINLTWTCTANNETGFRLERATNGTFNENKVVFDNLAVDSDAYSDTPVVFNSTYYYRVYAFNGQGDSAPSNTATVTVPGSLFGYAIIALNGNLSMVGNANTVSDPSSPAEGDVYAKGNITMTGNATVNGDATATGSISTSGNARVTGIKTANLNPPLSLTAIDIAALKAQANAGAPDINALKAQAQSQPPAKKKTGSYNAVSGDVLGTNGNKYSWITGDLTITPNNVTLNGVLLVGGKVTVSGSGSLKGTGTIISESTNATQAIYVTGNGQLKAEGGDMQVIATAGGIKSNGNGGVVARIYAPNGAINFSGNNNIMTIGPMHSTKSLTISANSQVALGGTVWFEQTITMTGNSGLQGSGSVLAGGNIKITGNGSSQPTSDPPLLVSENGTIELTGNGWLSAVAYAPNNLVKLTGNGYVYGSVIGKSVSFTGNAQVKYPVALRQW